MTCEHGFIGACAVCDGGGQIPEDEQAKALSESNGRDWSDMNEYERETYRDEFRLFDCDGCGEAKPINQIRTVRSSSGETDQCESCRKVVTIEGDVIAKLSG